MEAKAKLSKLMFRPQSGLVLLLVGLIHLSYVCSTDSDQPTFGLVTTGLIGAPTDLPDEASGADASTVSSTADDDSASSRATTIGETSANASRRPSPSDEPLMTAASTPELPPSTTAGATLPARGGSNATYAANMEAARATDSGGTDQPTSDSGEVHWLLFTSWHMPMAMVCVEILAYCVTLFIVFGFGQKRSKAKRFGHFSWKRPNPFLEEIQMQELSPSPRAAGPGPAAAAAAGGNYLAGSRAERSHMMPNRNSKLRAKKPSVRGHRP